MSTLQCESSGVYKPRKTKKKLKLEGTSSRECDCPCRMHGYFKKNTYEWWLAIVNGVHNHEFEPRLDGHLLADSVREEEKKRVVDMTKSLELSRNILMDFKKKQRKCDEYKTSVQCRC